MLLLESKRILPGSSRERKTGCCRHRLAGRADLCSGDERVRSDRGETSPMTHLVRRGYQGRIALAVVALVATACGSTVQNAGSAPGGANGSQALSVPGGTQASGAPGTVVGGSSGGAVGSAGTGAAGGTGGGLAAGQSGAVGSGNASISEPGDGPGVTNTTINIGAVYDPDAAAADSAIGAAGANPGDVKAETEAVVRYVNSHGGVAHRKLNPIWYKESTSDSAATTEQRMCSTWTQDNKVFVFEAGEPLLDQCTADAHGVAVDAGRLIEETTPQNRKYPAVVNISSFNIDHSMAVTVNGLAKQGYFNNGAKVGIVTWDDAYYRYGISAGANPALARLGLKNVPVQYVAVPQSYGDLGATSSSAGSAVLKFRTMGIDHVIVLDGPAGVASGAILWIEWSRQADSQQFYPRHGLNSTSGFNALASAIPQKEMENSIGVGWFPSLEETSSDWAKTPLSSNAKLCLQIMKDAGQQESGANAQAIQFGICDKLFLLKQLFDPITGPLNQQTALAAINALGTRYTPMLTFGLNITAQRHDGAYLVRNMAFQDSCTSYRYTSQPYNPY